MKNSLPKKTRQKLLSFTDSNGSKAQYTSLMTDEHLQTVIGSPVVSDNKQERSDGNKRKTISKKPVSDNKTDNNSTARVMDPISTTIDRDWYAWRERPVSEAYINALSDQLIEWATNEPKALRVSTWLRSQKISRATAEDWRKAHPRFERAYREAMEAIGDRREIGAIERTYDANSVFRSLHQFDSTWHEQVNKYHSDLKKEETSVLTEAIKVVMTNREPTGKIKPPKESNGTKRDTPE